ncbi:uncharacterized protein LOC134834623 [Culicoides brevitarsis]|uniref:uncharacterized protein LOC134834623 n=1 Tax=Culicoides brevitarsis TaxID=469753 RepID=UPI00307B47E9
MSDSAARGRGHLALSRHKLGSWNTLLEFLPKDPNKNDDESAVTVALEPKDKDAHANTFVSRLDEHLMGLYGLFPETDKFSAVVCDCGSIVKPQGFKNHLARNHSSSTNGGLRASKSDSLYFSNYATTSSSSNNGSSLRSRDKDNNYSSSNSPASSTSSTPVKNPEDFSGILPNSSNVVVKHKHKHKSESSKSSSSSSKYKSKSGSISHHSSDSQPGTDKQVPEFIVNATSTSLDSSTYTFSASKTTGSGATTVTSSSSSSSKSSKGRHRHSKHSKKAADIYDPDKHCGVLSHASSEEGGKPCVRSFSCKIHSVQQRREVLGRSRSFDALLLEMGREPPPEIISIDIESNSSSCSSVMEKQSETSEALRIKEQIELPTIVLRKLEHDVVQGIDNRAIAELLEKNAIVVKKEEPMELQVMEPNAQMDVQNADQMPPQELFELISQVEDAAENEQNILTMEQLTNLVEETNKNDMFQMGTTELHCRTIAFPLSVFYLMKNNVPTSTFVQQPLLEQPGRTEMKFDNSTFQTLDSSEQLGQYYDPTNNQIRFDLGTSNDANTANLQNFSAAMTTKPSHDLLSNILTLQELVPLVPDNYCDVYAKVCDQNLLSDCSSLFPMLTTVHDADHVSDKQQFETDYRAIKSCLYPNLPKPSAVNTFGLKRMGGGSTISRKALYLRKTLLVDSDKKFKLKTEGTNYATANVQSPHGMLLTSSAAVNKGRKRSFLASTAVAKQKASDLLAGHRLQNSFTNDTNKMDIDSNLDEILQPASKRQLFVSRY